MSRVEVHHRPTPEIVDHVDRHCRDLSDLGRVTLHHADDGYLGILVRSTDDGIAGYAQVSTAHHSSVLEVCAPADIAEHLVGAALGECSPGENLRWWIHHCPHPHEDVARRLGFGLERELHEMRRPLPADRRSTLATRDFDPATDRDRWLEVNNQAFADHPEQGGWSLADFDRRRSERWHDDAALRLLEIDGRVVGFCWVKAEGSTGEIYVIGVDPAFHGRGFGRELSLAGLDWMADHRLDEGRLFVDTDNRRAVAMYSSLGFATVRTDRSYVATA